MLIDAKVEVQDDAIRQIVPEGLSMEMIATGFGFTEGPVWHFDSLLFVDYPRSRTIRLRILPEGPEVTTFRYPNNRTNGQTLDKLGRLVVCESGSRRVTRTEMDGSITILAERYQGKRLNSPNDIVVRSDGSIYFTDPAFGVFAGPWKELPFCGVYRIAPDGELVLLVDDFPAPNGLAFSPDESVLHVCDTRKVHIRAFDVDQFGNLSNDRLFFDMSSYNELPSVDGMRVDQEGNVYCTGPGGLWLIAPSGKCLGRIRFPEFPTNLAWGDDDFRTLYVVGRSNVYRLRLNVPGVRPMPKHVTRDRDGREHS